MQAAQALNGLVAVANRSSTGARALAVSTHAVTSTLVCFKESLKAVTIRAEAEHTAAHAPGVQARQADHAISQQAAQVGWCIPASMSSVVHTHKVLHGHEHVARSWRLGLGLDTPSRYLAMSWNTCKLLLLLLHCKKAASLCEPVGTSQVTICGVYNNRLLLDCHVHTVGKPASMYDQPSSLRWYVRSVTNKLLIVATYVFADIGKPSIPVAGQAACLPAVALCWCPWYSSKAS